MADRNQQTAEALERINFLTEKYNLNPNLLKYFREGKVYYTECIVPGFWASMDDINYDSKYVEIVNDLEKIYDVLVYHCILTGSHFSMLYVSSNEKEWEIERPSPKSEWIMAATYNIEGDYVEFGDIKVSVATQTLYRIG